MDGEKLRKARFELKRARDIADRPIQTTHEETDGVRALLASVAALAAGLSHYIEHLEAGKQYENLSVQTDGQK